MNDDTANNMHPRIRERRFWVKYLEWKRLCYSTDSRLADQGQKLPEAAPDNSKNKNVHPLR